MSSLKNILLGPVAALLVISCGGGGSGGGADSAATVLEATPREKLSQREARSCEAVKSYVVRSIARLYTDGGYFRCIECFLTLGGVPVAEGAGADAAGDSFTGTNNQETGVDELDRLDVDQDGHFYVLDGRHLVVAIGNPAADLREIGALELTPDGTPSGLTLDEANDRLVVEVSSPAPARVGTNGLLAPVAYYEPLTELLFVDVSDPAEPILESRLAIEGRSVALRRVDDRAHLVSHFTPALPAAVVGDTVLADLQMQYLEADPDSDEARSVAEAIEQRIDELLADTAATDFLPRRWRASADGPYAPLPEGGCGGVTLPEVAMRFALTSVTSVDTDGENAATLSLTNDAWQAYASRESVYLYQTSGGWWWRDQQRQQTAIYRVGIGDADPQYRSVGLVEGWVESSFQLSEYERTLRVATNRDEFDPANGERMQDNHLFVLEDDDAGGLEVVGSVRGYAPGERIFSARFLGDRGFVVTFRQVDPLFAFDLSDPRDPRLLGELEIPGVSTYMHPLDEAHLLTIGINGDDSGLDWRMRLQIFDVQDLTRPRLLHVLVPEFGMDAFAWSPAIHDHLAFNYFPAAGVLTVPLQHWGRTHDEHFSGFASFGVSVQDGLTDLGRMDHSDLARETYCPDGSAGASAVACDEGYYLESATPARSVGGEIGGQKYVFTVSDVGIKVAHTEDVGTAIAVLPLTYPNDFWWWY